MGNGTSPRSESTTRVDITASTIGETSADWYFSIMSVLQRPPPEIPDNSLNSQSMALGIIDCGGRVSIRPWSVFTYQFSLKKYFGRRSGRHCRGVPTSMTTTSGCHKKCLIVVNNRQLVVAPSEIEIGDDGNRSTFGKVNHFSPCNGCMAWTPVCIGKFLR